MLDVAIIGGGVIGCAIGRELTRFRLGVTLIDKEAGFGTSKSDGGIIHGGHHTEPGTLKGELAWAGTSAGFALRNSSVSDFGKR